MAYIEDDADLLNFQRASQNGKYHIHYATIFLTPSAPQFMKKSGIFVLDGIRWLLSKLHSRRNAAVAVSGNDNFPTYGQVKTDVKKFVKFLR